MDDFISGDYMGIKHYNLVEYLSREYIRYNIFEKIVWKKFF